ncbi:NAD(P)/FAD-dependent oxidoreductase [Candidatus Pelagibacter sp.]|nr:NAD(P)/FAD-dependent oxidoreductase [Candidatus Pelagibacter sp.]
MQKINTVVIGGGQAGLAISEHLNNHNIPHIIFEKNRLVENWRTGRWDSLVANGPAWHDRFPTLEFEGSPNNFVHKDVVVSYFEKFAKKINAPIKTGVNVEEVTKLEEKSFQVKTTDGNYLACNIVVATGAFQKPIIPKIIPEKIELKQIHSRDYLNPNQLQEGGVLVIGSGSSGAQISDELLRSGKKIYLSIGPHNRPPRNYRGKDNVWWFGALGVWQKKTPDPNTQHVTIAVSGYNGGKTIDFRKFANQGMHLVGMTKKFKDGILYFENDLKKNLDRGDQDYLSVLDQADGYIKNNNLNFPLEEGAKIIEEDPSCVKNPTLELDIVKNNIKNIIWATGYSHDFNWLKVDTFDETGKPDHYKGVSKEKGIYFLGLPWLSMRGSSFIWGVWQDAKYLGEQISKKNATIDQQVNSK